MDYAIQLLIPIGLGLWAGAWLTQTYGASPLWTVLLTILGMVMGLVMMARRLRRESANPSPHREDDRDTRN